MKHSFPIKATQIMTGIGMAAALAFLTSGCASLPPPTAQMAVSKAAIDNASNAGATELAPLQLRSARDKMDAAERAISAQDYMLAKQLSEEAEVDAQLAFITSRSLKTQRSAQELQEGNRVLRQEIDRNTQ